MVNSEISQTVVKGDWAIDMSSIKVYGHVIQAIEGNYSYDKLSIWRCYL